MYESIDSIRELSRAKLETEGLCGSTLFFDCSVNVESYNNTASRGGSTFIEGNFIDVHNCYGLFVICLGK